MLTAILELLQSWAGPCRGRGRGGSGRSKRVGVPIVNRRGSASERRRIGQTVKEVAVVESSALQRWLRLHFLNMKFRSGDPSFWSSGNRLDRAAITFAARACQDANVLMTKGKAMGERRTREATSLLQLSTTYRFVVTRKPAVLISAT